MHGEELIHEELNLPQHMRHTFVSEIGKLGLVDLADDNTNHATFCRKMEVIKTIFKNEPTINEESLDNKLTLDNVGIIYENEISF